jgi:hypothetical protein
MDEVGDLGEVGDPDEVGDLGEVGDPDEVDEMKWVHQNYWLDS